MRRFVMAATVSVLALGLAGCAQPSFIATDSGGAPSVVAPEMAPGSGDAARDGEAQSLPGEQQFVTTGEMTVSVEAPTDAADAATRIVQSAGGHVAARNDRRATESSAGRSDLTLRIPSALLSAVLADLEELGETVRLSHQDVEVTMQVRDLDARIGALQAAVDRLLALMVDADSTQDLIAIETALTQRQVELEQLTSQQRYLADQVALSTIHLSLIAPEETPAVDPESFWSGLVAGWNAFVGFWASVLVALGVLTPWLALLALVALVVIVIVRSSVRRSRARSAEAVAVGASAPQEPAHAQAPTSQRPTPPADGPSAVGEGATPKGDAD